MCKTIYKLIMGILLYTRFRFFYNLLPLLKRWLNITFKVTSNGKGTFLSTPLDCHLGNILQLFSCTQHHLGLHSARLRQTLVLDALPGHSASSKDQYHCRKQSRQIVTIHFLEENHAVQNYSQKT